MGFNRLYRSLVENTQLYQYDKDTTMYACQILIDQDTKASIVTEIKQITDVQEYRDKEHNDYFILYKGESFNEAFCGVLKGLDYFDNNQGSLLEIVSVLKPYKHIQGEWTVCGGDYELTIVLETV